MILNYGPWVILIFSIFCPVKGDSLTGFFFSFCCITSNYIYDLIPASHFDYYYLTCIVLDYSIFNVARVQKQSRVTEFFMFSSTLSATINLCGLVIVGLSWYSFVHEIIMIWIVLTMAGGSGGSIIRFLNKCANRSWSSCKNAALLVGNIPC